MVDSEIMLDGEEATDSVTTPFEAYRASLRSAKKQPKEARKAAEALETLEETMPLWWQMTALARQNVDHQSIQAWQKKAPDLLDSAQNDFISGNESRIREGAGKVEQAHSGFRNAKKEISNNINKIEKIIQNKKNEIERLKKSKEKIEEDVLKYNKEIENEKWSRKKEFLKSLFISFGITVLISIPATVILKIVFLFAEGNPDAVLVPFLAISWIIITLGRYNFEGKNKSISSLKEKIRNSINKKEKISKKIEFTKEEIEDVYPEKESMKEDINKIPKLDKLRS